MKNVFRLALTPLIIIALLVATACSPTATPTPAPAEPTVASTVDPSAGATAQAVAAAAGGQTPTQICDAATPATDPANRQFEAPEQVLEPGVDYRAVFCTGAGAIYIDLLEGVSPITVNSFVFLAQQGYYNNTTFHRVIGDFMAQGGDPTATGTGGPGYQFQNERAGFLTFDRPGWLAMANAGADTNGSQFFITTVPYPSLNFNYTIFGEVLEGQQNVAAIQLRDPNTATTPGTSLDTVVIITDPTTVATTYIAPTPATQAELLQRIEYLRTLIPDALLVDEASTGAFTLDQVVETAPETLRGQYRDFLNEHNFEYRVSNRITNASCNAQRAPYWAIGYALDRFATAEDARAALESGFFGQLATSAGFTEAPAESLPQAMYTQTRAVCDVESIDAVTYWQRGHFIATVRVTYPASNADATTEQWLNDQVGVRTYEQIFADALRRELR